MRPSSEGPDRGEPRSGDLGELVARVADHRVDGPERRRRLAALSRALLTSARAAGVGALGTGRWLTDVVTAAAPRLPVRDASTLRAHHPGQSDEQVAAALVRAASLSTAAVGAAAGALAAVEFAAPPALLAAPAQLAAETVAVTAVEVKLVAELHELFGQPAPGGLAARASAYLVSWARQRSVDPMAAGGVGAVLGQAAKHELRSRIVRRLGRSMTSLAPFLAGALAGSQVNRRATRTLGDTMVADLRARRAERSDTAPAR